MFWAVLAKVRSEDTQSSFTGASALYADPMYLAGGSVGPAALEQKCIAMGAVTPDIYHQRLVVGGRTDFLVASLHTMRLSSLRSAAFFGLEVAAGTIIASLATTLLIAVQNAAPLSSSAASQHGKQGGSQAAGIGIAAANRGASQLVRKIIESPMPQVFVIVMRAELQSYATNIRRQLLKRGIHCQRRVDRIVDTTQFRRRAKNCPAVVWVVQLRDHPPTGGVLYKLQYYGDVSRQPTETEMVFDDSKKVIDYLIDYFSANAEIT